MCVHATHTCECLYHGYNIQHTLVDECYILGLKMLLCLVGYSVYLQCLGTVTKVSFSIHSKLHVTHHSLSQYYMYIRSQYYMQYAGY